MNNFKDYLRQALNEDSPANPQIGTGSGFGGGGQGGGQGGGDRQKFVPGYAEQIPWGEATYGWLSDYFANLPWEQWGWETGGDFQQWWTANGNNPNVDWAQYGFTQHSNGDWYAVGSDQMAITMSWENGNWQVYFAQP
jgi:hypothetical protein